MSAVTEPTPPAPTPPGAPAYAELAATIIQTRQQFGPKRLHEPGPSDAQIQAFFLAAAAAPDHGQILPWRFVVVPGDRRDALGEVFAAALRERDPNADDHALAEARDKAHRGPFLALAIVREHADGHPEIPAQERLVSMGCAIQNILLIAHANGFGAGLVSGQALDTDGMRRLFGLRDGERAVCFLAIGTVQHRKPIRPRPRPEEFVSRL